MGKPAHDARIAAIMLAHNVTNILTLNPDDFSRYQGITPVTPSEVLQQTG
jgi:predicted nucleic acid-binding protein